MTRTTTVALAQAGDDLEQAAAEVEGTGSRGLVLVADLADVQALAAESRPDGIRACVLYPGAMATN